MYNAQIKLTALAVCVISIFSCSNGSSGEKQSAKLFDEAKNHYEAGDYQSALLLLDSIDHAYPQAIDVRKDVRLLRPQVIEQKSARELSVIDSLQVVNSIKGDSLNRLLEFVHNPIEGFYVAKGTGKTDVRSTNGLHSRVSPDYHFYLTATCPAGTSAVGLSLESDGEGVRSATVPYDGERNSHNSAHETITFTEAESEPLATFVENHPDSPISITFFGSSGKNYRMTLDKIQRDAIIAAHGLVTAANNDKMYRMEKARLQKQLEIARKQLAEVSDK